MVTTIIILWKNDIEYDNRQEKNLTSRANQWAAYYQNQGYIVRYLNKEEKKKNYLKTMFYIQ